MRFILELISWIVDPILGIFGWFVNDVIRVDRETRRKT